LQKTHGENRVGVLEKLCSGTFYSWLLAFPSETWTSPKMTSSVASDFQKIRNCKVLEVPLPRFRNATLA
jgi:hypothetical protein